MKENKDVVSEKDRIEAEYGRLVADNAHLVSPSKVPPIRIIQQMPPATYGTEQ